LVVPGLVMGHPSWPGIARLGRRYGAPPAQTLGFTFRE
jgi:hypothetical protein